MAPETIEKLAFLVLGWLLGLLGPAIVDAIRRRRDLAELKKGLCIELHELQYRLILTVYSLRYKLGTPDNALLLWMRPIVAKYEGLNPSENFLKSLDEQLKLSDEQLHLLSDSTESTKKGVALKRYATPLLSTKLGQLSGIGEHFQNILLEIRSHLDILNEDIDQYRFYFNLTFTSNLSSENRALVLDNIRLAYDNMATQARIIVDLIEKVQS